jgi:glycosyltransferase involved in cell wall biosynthesis
MWRDYLKQGARHSLLPKYAAIATASDYMRRELIAHGVKPERVYKIPMPVSGAFAKPDEQRAAPRASATWRLSFLGRMSRLKGVGILLDAIPAVAAALNSQIELNFIGDGPDRAAWEENARRVQSRDRRISVRMAGWMKPKEVRAALGEADLLVVPSLCPETFGLVGVEAGRLGVPAAAFDVGGISEWLVAGVNGQLAPGDPPSAGGLADAIVRCLSDPAAYARMRNGALEISRRFDTKLHVEALITIFHQVAEPESLRESELGKESGGRVVAQS